MSQTRGIFMCGIAISTFLTASQTRALVAEYLYPVAKKADGSSVLVLHQKSPANLELCEWDPISKRIDLILLSRFTPAGLKLLPTEKGYSFIDSGIIRIKDFMKRSPRTLELSEPIYDFAQLQWHDGCIAYTSAKLRDHYGVFAVDRNGTVKSLLWDGVHDYQYPQWIGDDLFFVKRLRPCSDGHADGYYQIARKSYQSSEMVTGDSDCEENRTNLFAVDSANENRSNLKPTALEGCRSILEKIVHPVAFLNMVSSTEGYYISHPAQIAPKALFVTLDCYQIKDSGDGWQQQRLFSFELPTDLLLHGREARLYESILPFLPRNIGQEIYFSNVVRTEYGYTVNLFAYNAQNGSVRQCTQSSEGVHHFSPLQVGDAVISGGMVSEHGGVHLWFDDEGIMRAEFLMTVL